MGKNRAHNVAEQMYRELTSGMAKISGPYRGDSSSSAERALLYTSIEQSVIAVFARHGYEAPPLSISITNMGNKKVDVSILCDLGHATVGIDTVILNIDQYCKRLEVHK